MGRLLVLALAAGAVFGQATVPFVGCTSDGMAGPMDAPKGKDPVLPIPAEAAQRLAYYSAGGTGVLGPRGWYCLNVYGSSGSSLLATPQPIDVVARRSGFAGPVIAAAFSNGYGSGMIEVAPVIARVFPAHLAYTRSVEKSFPGINYPRGPYPADKLTYKSSQVVEFETPAQTEGLGTLDERSRVLKGDDPIRGVAMLLPHRDGPDLLLLSVRLPAGLRDLTSTIMQQVERDAQKGVK